jgi:hypothetical protein
MDGRTEPEYFLAPAHNPNQTEVGRYPTRADAYRAAIARGRDPYSDRYVVGRVAPAADPADPDELIAVYEPEGPGARLTRDIPVPGRPGVKRTTPCHADGTPFTDTEVEAYREWTRRNPQPDPHTP